MDYTYEKLNRKLEALSKTQTHTTDTHKTTHSTKGHSTLCKPHDQEEEN
jgi:hypothetical protein